MPLLQILLLHLVLFYPFTIGYKQIQTQYEIVGSPMQPFMTDKNSAQYIAAKNETLKRVSTVLQSFDIVKGIVLRCFIPNCDTSYKALLVIRLKSQPNTTVEKELSQALGRHIESYFPENATPCPSESVTLENGKEVEWPASYATGNDIAVPCGLKFDPCVYALRKCEPTGTAQKWGSVDQTRCTNTLPTAVPTALPDVIITPDNAKEVTEQLILYIRSKYEKGEALTEVDFVMAVNMVLKLTDEKIIKSLEPDQILTVVSFNVEGFSFLPQKSAPLKARTATRILKSLDNIGRFVPIKGSDYRFKSDGLAFGLLDVNATEKRNILLGTTFTPANGFQKVYVQLSESNPVPPKSADYVIIPMKSVKESRSLSESKKPKRVTMFALKNDDLYQTIDSNSIPAPGDKTFVRNQVASRITRVSVHGAKVKNLNKPLKLGFNLVEQQVVFNLRCAFWVPKYYNDYGVWNDRECKVVSKRESYTICGCDHLTDFALLMDIYSKGSDMSTTDKRVLSILSVIGCVLSAVTLGLTIMTYCFYRNLRTLTPSQVLLNLCVALLISNLIFIVGINDYTLNHTLPCKIIAMALHYFLLSSVAWMGIEGYNLYLSLIRVFKHDYHRLLLKYCMVGWGVPFLIVLATALVNLTDNYGLISNSLCWLKSPTFYVSFLIPVVFVLILNLAVFGGVVILIRQVASTRRGYVVASGIGFRLKGAVGVLNLLGLTWLFAFFAINSELTVFRYMFAISNAFQGFFIFLFYCLIKKDVRENIRKSMSVSRQLGTFPSLNRSGATKKSLSISYSEQNTETVKAKEQKADSPNGTEIKKVSFSKKDDNE